MKNVIPVILIFISLPLFSQTNNHVAWDQGEREMLLGLNLFIRQGVNDIGQNVNSFFYKNSLGYTVYDPVKFSRGSYRIVVLIGSEFNNEGVFLGFDILRISEKDAFIQRIILERTDSFTGQISQVIAESFLEKSMVLMHYFSQ